MSGETSPGAYLGKRYDSFCIGYKWVKILFSLEILKSNKKIELQKTKTSISFSQ